MIKTRRNVAGFLAIPILIFAAVLMVGGYFGYTKYYLSSERIYAQMTNKMQNVKKGHIDAQATVNLGGAKSLLDLFLFAVPELSEFKVSGDYDLTDENNKKFNLRAQLSQLSQDVFDIQMRSRDQKTYYFIDYASSYSGDFRYYPKAWFIQKSKDYVDPSISREIKNIVPLQNAVISIAKLSDTNIGKLNVYHLSLTLDDREFGKNIQRILEAKLQVKKDDTDDRKIKKLLENIIHKKTEVYIGKNDMYLYRIHQELESEIDGATARLAVEINFSDFDNISDISNPGEFVEVAFDPKEDVSERLTSVEQTRVRHINYIANAVFEFYKKNGVLPDVDGKPNSYSYPASPTCIDSYTKDCFNLAKAGFETNNDYLVPRYMSSVPYGTTYMTYHRGGKLFVTALDSAGKEIVVERELKP